MNNLNNRFDTIITSLEGDEALLSELAIPVAERYELTANQIMLLAENEHFSELIKLVHKLKSTWSLYVDEVNNLPEQLENAAKKNNTETVLILSNTVVNALKQTALELRAWVENYKK